jgi:2-keto-4-pentenoate hydratase/2-oxohepta-3-ene-1,7-dioic acid hydratase in catechol pathway
VRVKIVVFGPKHLVGGISGGRVVDFASAGLPSDLRSFIDGGEAVVAAAAAVLGSVESGKADAIVHELSSVHLHAPHVPGARIACAGGNFADHTAAMAARRTDVQNYSADLREVAADMRARGIWGFWKVGRDAGGPGDAVIYPAYAHRLDYEAEAAVILARQVKDAAAADLKALVWGVTLFGDWSIRDGHEADAPLKFGTSKNFDGSYSIGPCIVVGENVDCENIDIETYVNGERRQSFNTRDMVVSFGEYLAHLSRDFTFYPGDMITGGTAAGTAADTSDISADGVFAPERFLKPGDRVEIRSPQIGSFETTIVAKPAA